jgi:putative tricarboxylic transport membrane protein
MTKRDRVVIYCFLVFSFLVCEESWRLGLGSFNQPGPGFVPFGAATIIITMAIIQLVIGRGKRIPDPDKLFKKDRISKVCTIVAICFGYGLFLEALGFVLSTGLFVFVSLDTIERKGWKKTLGISALTAFGAWLLFDYFLQMQAPKGTWFYPIYEKIGGILWK